MGKGNLNGAMAPRGVTGPLDGLLRNDQLSGLWIGKDWSRDWVNGCRPGPSFLEATAVGGVLEFV